MSARMDEIRSEKDPFVRLALAAKPSKHQEIREKNPGIVLMKAFERSYKRPHERN